MIHANTVTAAACSLHSMMPASDLRASAAWRVREEREYYITDLLEDEDDAADPALSDAACAHTRRHVREAQGLFDDAVNLVGVLLDAIEQDTDTRAAQARTVLEIAVECLHKAHHTIDEQESRYRNLFLAYFALKREMEDDREDWGEDLRLPLDD